MQKTVPSGCNGDRLDLWLVSAMPGFSRSRVQSLIKNGSVTVDGRMGKAHLKLHAGMNVEVSLPPEPASVGLQAQDIEIEVIHEDSDMIVVNKPAGLVCHPAAGHATGTLVNALLFRCRDLSGIGGEMRPGIVHRLDRDTSGVMVVAKNERSMMALSKQFKDRTVAKEYIALIRGVPGSSSGRIETLIGRSRHDRKKMSTRPAGRGRTAVSSYKVLEALGAASLVAVRIETGRTHQIRVHMAHIGTPVLGDRQYGRTTSLPGVQAEIPRQMLHARSLTLDHPSTGRRLEFIAPLPSDIEALLADLRSRSKGDGMSERGGSSVNPRFRRP